MDNFKDKFVEERIELIYWIDSVSIEGWQSREHIEDVEFICVSCGIFIAENDNVLVLATSLDSYNHSTGSIAIPKVAIKSREVVWEKLSQ